MSENLSKLAGRKGIVDTLFEKLGNTAIETGSPSKEQLDKLAKEFLIGKANTYGVTTAYDFLKPENKGKKIYICNGSACLCAGTQNKLSEIIKTKFSEEEIGHMTCLGRCHENGAFQIGGINYSAKTEEEIIDILSTKSTSPDKDTFHVGGNSDILIRPFDGIEKYRSTLKQVLSQSADISLRKIHESKLRGRGGAGFPLGSKLETCKNEASDTKFIICNADEGDPGAYSDKYLLEQRPESVIFGMIISGYIVGAEWGIIYIRGEYPESVRIVESTIRTFRNNGLIGDNIANSGFNFDLKVIKAQGAYICGEETALINSIEGQRPEVRVRPPYPATYGLFGKPTIVNNVETIAAIPYIIEHGGRHYSKIGTSSSSGTKLLSLDSFFVKPGMYEIEMGTPLRSLIFDMAGGFREPVKALHIGGPLGGILPIDKIDEFDISIESFANGGMMLGHASVVCIPESMPMIHYLEHLFEFAAFESCGKCFPCRLGTKRAHELLHRAAEDDYKISRELFEDLLMTLKQGSLCGHGGGIPLPAYNALQYFSEELNQYFTT